MRTNSNQLSFGLSVHGQISAYIPDTHTDWWVEWLLRVCPEELDWLLALDLCMIGWAVFTLATMLWNRKLLIIWYFGKPFSRFSYPPFVLRPADEGPSTGPHGEGRLAGPSDLQRDWDDQRGEGVELDCFKTASFFFFPVVEKIILLLQTEISQQLLDG